MTENIDKSFIKRCIQQDRAAQKYLFEKYGKLIFSVIHRIVNDYDASNDILQDSFIEIFKDIQNLNNEASLVPWMKKIAVRKALRMVKSRQYFDELNENIKDESSNWNDEFTGEDLDKAIRELPDKTRAIFLLVSVEGYKHIEVAEMLNISEGTSKSQLNYAKTLLRNKLKEMYTK
ncbi:MAG: RNA polymerase sigma factor [Bacteroidales bacterium]|nr:RNA polymerase sigma factor [Bacteroidales bacterium]